MSATEIIDLGKDSSGRAVRLTRRMKAAFDRTCQECGVTPTIVQGAFMSGQGAAASAGCHDRSGCIDTRTWDLTEAQQEALIRAARSVGWAIWKRDKVRGGMDEHMHWVLLGEPDMAAEACRQESDYKAGFDGLASRGKDYHWRPPVIKQFDYNEYVEGDMPTMEELKKELVPVIVNQMMRRDLNEKGLTVAKALRQASRADDLEATLKTLPAQIAKATEAALPDGKETLTRAEVRAAAQKGAEAALLQVIADEDTSVEV